MPGRLRETVPFSLSAFIHGLVLGGLVISGVSPSRPGSVYDQEIRPYEKRLIFYNLHDKLPDVSPGKASAEKRPLRAHKKFNQNLVAGEKDLPVPPQLIRVPKPKIDIPKMLDLPNVVAAAPPRPVREFRPPPATPKPLPPSADLPAAPQLAAAAPPRPLPFDAALAKPQPRAFTPPPSRKALPPSTSADLPAPELQAAAQTMRAPVITHGFNAPPPKPRAPQAGADAPPPTPEISSSTPAPASIAIAGLDPVNRANIPPPPGSHDAGFSAGPELHPKGASEASAENASVTVPGLVTRGGSKEAPSSLLSVFAPLEHQVLTARAGTPAVTPPGATPPRRAGSTATHVSSSPDPRLNGRYIYTMAVQMPNVTSYSGSWIVWFADRDPETRAMVADLRAPVPVRKVDPKYIATAVEEKVEGVVRLSAVIRADGHVQVVGLLQHLDERLDRSAEEALAKWEFEPAMRDGVPVEVDAVFEIPFRLAPKTSR